MIQLQVLNYVINNKDTKLLDIYTEAFFPNYADEYNFIKKHIKEYKQTPDMATMVDNFDNFRAIDVDEQLPYLQAKLYEEYVYNETVNTINEHTDDFDKDAIKAKDAILKRLENLAPPNREYGVDIVKDAKERYDKHIDRLANQSDYVFTTGLPELDMIIGGIEREEELIVIYARTNNLKTWIAEKLAVSVWAEEKQNVGLFSPEMAPTKIGYRFDTLFKNFSNHGVMGREADFDSDEYKKYINKLSTKKLPKFNVITPLDFPDKIVTVTDLKNWIEALDLKMIVIDGLAYLTNERAFTRRKNTTENLTDIAEDLMTLSMEVKVPIIVVMQANRTGARDSEGEVSTESPELDTIRGSDGIAHNASKAISIYKAKDIVKLYISKNRENERGQHLYYQYDVNYGKFTYVPNPKDGLAINTSAEDTFNDDDSDEVF